MQAIPSPVYFEDSDSKHSLFKFGLQWNITPLSYSFGSNKMVSPLSFFFIRPVKRFSGSIELFFQPSLITGSYKYAQLKKFLFNSGARFILPVAQRGEYLALGLGMGYYNEKSVSSNIYEGMSYEASILSFYGMLGLKFMYKQNAPAKIEFGIYFKYY